VREVEEERESDDQNDDQGCGFHRSLSEKGWEKEVPTGSARRTKSSPGRKEPATGHENPTSPKLSIHSAQELAWNGDSQRFRSRPVHA
ncbi:MAG: hypothetical protein ACTHNQ_18715, partial [Microbacterium sp.]|uniref:hypothetical protein n=1 Tax=Microbacterium sp. TaxID=51671 RepID=UPI003F7F2AA6